MMSLLSTASKVAMAVDILHLASPLIIFLYFLVATTFSVCTLQTTSLRVKGQHVRRDIVLWFMFTVITLYIAQLTIIVFRVYRLDDELNQNEVVYVAASLIVWTVETLSLVDVKFPVWYPYYGSWILGLIVELTLIIIIFNFAQPILNIFAVINTAILALRTSVFLVLICVYLRLRNRRDSYNSDDAERQSLLHNRVIPKPASDENTSQGEHVNNAYGASSNTKDDDTSEDEFQNNYLRNLKESRERVNKRLRYDGSWWTYAKGFVVFFPYVWPVHDKGLQLRAVLVALCLLASNVLTVLIPRQLGIVTDSLVEGHAPWVATGIYAALTFIGSPACIVWFQFWLWLPLEQYSFDALSTAAHSHLLSLSSDFHDAKATADIHRAVIQGKNVTKLVDIICFQILPMFIDLALAFAYLSYLFGVYLGLITAATVISYLYMTTKLVSMTSQVRRKYVKDFMRELSAGYTSLENWKLASYFNNIFYEENRYASAVTSRLQADGNYKMWTHVITAAQGVIITLGLLGGCYIAIYQAILKLKTPGDFVVLLTYWAALRKPLQFFSDVFREISEYLMDAERLLELFQTKPSIIDRKGVSSLKIKTGEVKFEQVSFSYDERKGVLKDVNFCIAGGSTVALVGETGGGKSTILKLLNRFYDVTDGRILIDGQDIRDVTLRSLRDSIGVVPQEPSIFHDSIMNNIRYANLTANDDNVYEACKAAAIHDKIMSFPDGYNSKTGDRGLKLSGGEQQRIAIARAILKGSQIILLDEATSAVDTETEQLIQESLNQLCTQIINNQEADMIMVIKDGRIVETGTHDELVHRKGKYFDLWSKQIHVSPLKHLRSRASGEGEPLIINDLQPARPKTNLATLLRTTSHKDDDEDRGIKPPPKSPLKADAPEFIPRHMRSGSTASSISETGSTKSELKILKKKEKEEKKRLKKESSRNSSLVTLMILLHLYLQFNLFTHVEGDGLGWVDATRSEPARHLHGSVDGTQDSEVALDSLTESQHFEALADAVRNRRAAAPSDPPSGQSNGRRRPRHWNTRSRQISGEASDSGPSSSQDFGSEDASMGLAVPAPTPNDPFRRESVAVPNDS